jgi:predicted PurR-regulated permease PerM
VVGVIGGFYLLYRFSNVLFVLFVAAVLATAMRPAVQWLERRHVPQWGGVLLIYFSVALLTAGVGALLAPLLLSQTTQIVQDVPQYYQEARGELSKSNSELLRRVGNSLPQKPDLRAITGTTQQQAAASGDQSSVVGQGVGYLGAFIWAIFGGVAVALIAYFWTLDREKIVQAALLIVPIDSRPAARDIWDTAESKVGAYVRGQALLMLSIGVLCGVAFFFIGLKSALLLAVLAGLFEALPYIGPILTAVVAVFITLAESPDKIWWVVGAIVVIQQMENAILVPRIMDAAVGVNAIVTLLAFAAFGSLFGVVGAILAIPLAAIIQVLLDRWVLYRDDQSMAAIEGRDKTALVRYQAQDLAQDLRERLRARTPDQSLGVDSFEERVEAVVGEIDEILVQLATPPAPGATSTPRGQTS